MSGNSGVVLIYCPFGAEADAARIAGVLLERRLIACANIHESRSLYFWDGKLNDEKEWVLVCKTASSRAEAAERAIREMHTYSIPCILRLEPLNVNNDYQKWVFGEVTALRHVNTAVGEAGASSS
jgi:periplasmic divalent cation tolerance protein